MLRPRWYHLVPLVMLIPGTCSALGLRWSGGGSTLSVNVATRCTLEVFVGPGEVLPGDWRLLGPRIVANLYPSRSRRPATLPSRRSRTSPAPRKCSGS